MTLVRPTHIPNTKLEVDWMERTTEDIRDVLMRESEEFQQLSQRHRELDDRLNSLTTKFLLSQEEKLEEVTIKKKKLAIKDRMAFMLRRH